MSVAASISYQRTARRPSTRVVWAAQIEPLTCTAFPLNVTKPARRSALGPGCGPRKGDGVVGGTKMGSRGARTGNTRRVGPKNGEGSVPTAFRWATT